ncbi:S-LOCUS RECEPTOR KINASE (SRK) [Salix purpurea]|uniref:S-LOCUS RECEPTOR KINASE (SRK) n=1 Tax=Salix purpurea TaxID=77065 RepID=A0A9Q0V967_SALPP|nr:S-LOCUS RECEPTOR KINASE (SRK) [Salix purpurea]
MQLQDSGNLVLLDRNNVSLWGSFDHPTDTIVMGQSLAVGTSVDCYTSDNDRSDGDYRLVVTAGDAVLQWNRMSYWKLSAEPKGSQDSMVPVSFLALNDTGLFLLGSDRSTVVIKLSLGPANFRVAKLGFDGKFRVSKFVDKNWVQEFVSPDDECKIPLVCNKMGLCTSGRCSCPPNFHGDPLSKSGCTPTDASLALPSGCIDRKESNFSVFYVNLGSESDYFANEFMAPAKRDISLLACQDLCTRNCSCLGIFYGNSSASCYLLENPLGSIMGSSSSNRKRLGYVKTIVVSSRANKLNEATGFPIVGLILLPSSGVLLIIIVVLGFICWRRNRLYRTAKSKLGHGDSSSSELEIISVPGWEPRQAYFPLHALEMHEKKRYSELADSRLERRVTNEEVRKLVKVALCCLHEDPSLRPAMVTVVSMLEGISPVTEPRQESLNFLRFYGRRFGEASRIEGSNERNEFGFSSSDKLMSCMSAQQLSGPR